MKIIKYQRGKSCAFLMIERLLNIVCYRDAVLKSKLRQEHLLHIVIATILNIRNNINICIAAMCIMNAFMVTVFTLVRIVTVMVMTFTSMRMRMHDACIRVNMHVSMNMGVNCLTGSVSYHQNQIFCPFCHTFVNAKPHICHHIAGDHRNTGNISKKFVHQRKSRNYVLPLQRKINLSSKNTLL